jgi:hypothetical protein
VALRSIAQPIANRARARAWPTALSQSRALRATATIVLRGDASPVVEGIPEARITGESSRDDTALTGSLGDRLEGFPSLCEQRGEDDPTVS